MDPFSALILTVLTSALKDAAISFGTDLIKDCLKDGVKGSLKYSLNQFRRVISKTPEGQETLAKAEALAITDPDEATALLRQLVEQQANALRADAELMESLRGLSALLQAPPVTLPALTPGQSAAIKAGERHLETRLDHPEPAAQSDETRHQTRLTFTTRLTPFRGRDAEFGQLQTFAADDAPFRWWLITGNGGAGKSRLAQELCLSLAEQGWHTGFLRHSPTALAGALIDNGGVISGDAPVLLVVDYCDPHAEALRRLIACLQRRPPEATPKVRLLLVDRDAEQEWYTKKLTGRSDDRAAVEASRHAAPLALPDFDDGQAWAMAEGYITAVAGLAKTHAAPVERATFLTHAREADPTLRPLTVLLLADGPAHGIALGSGTPAQLSTLLEDHLQRLEQRFWHGVDKKHRTLLCAATLFRGLSPSDLKTPWPDLEDALPYAGTYDPDQYRRLTGSPDARSQLAPLQPDLLGEYYVLDTLQRQSTGAFDLRDSLLQARREKSAQLGSVLFAHLCTRDFAAVNAPSRNRMIPAQAAASLLLAITPDSPALTLLKAMMTVNATAYYGKAQNIPAASALLDALNTARTTFPDDAGLRLRWAQGAFNLITALGSAGDIPAASALLDALDSARTAFPDDADLRLEWAKGAVNLIAALGTAGDIPAAAALLDALDTARTAFPDDAELRLEWAKGAVNLINALENPENLPEAKMLWKHLVATLNALLDDTKLRRQWAMGAVNMLKALGVARDLNNASVLFDELSTIRDKYCDDAELRRQWAMGAVNMLISFRVAQDPSKASALLMELDTVRNKFSGDAELRLRWAKGAFNLAIAYANAGDIPEALTRFDAVLSTPGLPEEFLAQVQGIRQKYLALLPQGV